MATKKRRALSVESLENREVLSASVGVSAIDALPSLLDKQLVIAQEQPLAQPSLSTLAPDALANVPAGKIVRPANPGSSEGGLGDTLDVPALEALFADADSLARLLVSPTDAPASSPSSSPASERPAAKQAALTSPTQVEGWHFLHNYTRKAIRNEEQRHGPLRDREDLVHQVFVEWREQVGENDLALGQLLNKDSPERLVLRKAARRVLDHARYVRDRDSQIEGLSDQPAPANSSEAEWRELQMDVSQGAGNLDPRERQLLELRRQGMTLDEIGAEVGLAKQRVCEAFVAIIDRLQALYC
jgi:RNA polymerase sigma factor (sigma-70 family)